MSKVIIKGLLGLFMRFSGALLNFLLSIYLARYLIKTDYGNYQFIITILTGLSVLSRVGMDTFLMKKLPGETNNRKRQFVLKNSIFLVLITSISISLLCLSAYYSYLCIAGGKTKNVWFICLSLVPLSFYTLISSIEKAKENINIALFISNILPAIFIFLILISNNNYDDKLHNVFYAYFLSSVFVMLFSYFILLFNERKRKSTTTLNKIYPWLFFKKGFRYTNHSLMTFILLWIDTLIVGIFLGGEFTAEYSVASRFTLIILLAMSVYDGIIAPKVIKEFRKNKYSLKLSGKIYATILFILFFVVITFVLTKYIVLFYGNEYSKSLTVAKILILAYAVRGMASLPGYLLIAMNEVKILNKVLAVSLLINIGTSYGLMRYYSINGVAIGTLITNIIVVFLSYLLALYKIRIKKIAV